ncbi:alkyl hydroperoxide reductase subunit C [Actinomyces sp. B33]|uniref:alkyl hydroperoxide reductase subunit C n=1 Tax=Actinomyces sp. B33 TaxID=2942131 RepID=UPI0023405C9F|nr:alkyl hydroperoxide reductase subunit C [Actinomyces sp. B33]MDC4233683.1 alkyl hydroperoxide reductase subunit C [Actinomyces sp. B33]
MSLINTRAAEWSGTAYCDGDFIEVSSEDHRGQWAILFFYPADFTFVCPTELEDMADHYDEFQQLGVKVYAFSTDKHFSHKAWHDTSERIGKIRFPMVGDPTCRTAAAFDALREDEGAADRSTILIDPDGVIQYVETTSEGVGRNAAELVRKVRAAQYVHAHPGEVCPAKWEEGEETLAPSFDLAGKL